MIRKRSFIKWLTCIIWGHPVRPTGRHAILLIEVNCQRCYKMFVAHTHHPGMLQKPDEDFNRIISDYALIEGQLR